MNCLNFMLGIHLSYLAECQRQAIGLAAFGRCLSSVQLERVTKKIPEEMLQVLLAMGKEEDALELCRKHGLETDHVFVSLWRMHSVNHLSIMSYLEPIHDRVLVIKECTRRVATTSAEELVLLQFGLKVCDELLG